MADGRVNFPTNTILKYMSHMSGGSFVPRLYFLSKENLWNLSLHSRPKMSFKTLGFGAFQSISTIQVDVYPSASFA